MTSFAQERLERLAHPQQLDEKAYRALLDAEEEAVRTVAAKQADAAMAAEQQSRVAGEHMHGVLGQLESKAGLKTAKQLEEGVCADNSK